MKATAWDIDDALEGLLRAHKAYREARCFKPHDELEEAFERFAALVRGTYDPAFATKRLVIPPTYLVDNWQPTADRPMPGDYLVDDLGIARKISRYP